MRFSVLMSLYYKECSIHLKQCLQSLVEQTLPADEIILVLDGKIGPDLENVITECKKALPLTIIRLPENIGLGLALNEGLKHCRYEWVFRMDTDDICVPERFRIQMDAIKKDPAITLVGGQIMEFDDDIEQGTIKSVSLTHQQILQWAKKRNPFNHMTVAYKKSAVLAAGGYQHHLLMEDYNLWLRMLANNNQMQNLPQVLVYARTGQKMIKKRSGLMYIKSEWQLFRLKSNLKVGNACERVVVFLLRSAPRVLPTFVLTQIYRLLRSI